MSIKPFKSIRVARITHAEALGWRRCYPYRNIGSNKPRWFWNGGYYDWHELPQLPASYYADTSGWDETHYIRSINGSALWESAQHTSRGGSIRLMRLDNATLKVYSAYVPLNHPMELSPK